jgi:hypothetical protein
MDDFHNEFWVAIAAAGPVLALAVVVTINSYDWGKPFRQFRETLRKGHPPDRYLLAAVAGQPVSWLGFIAAGVATVQALWSLASEVDIGPTSLPIILLIVTGVCLPLQSLCTGTMKEQSVVIETNEPR